MNTRAKSVAGSMGVFFISTALFVWRSPGIDVYFADIDLGYLLAMATQIQLGKYPYVDFYSVYGPMSSWLLSIVILPSNIWPVTLLCSTMYGTCLTIVFCILRRQYSFWVSFLISLSAIFLVGKFHKWFIWFFPLILIYVYQSSLLSQKNRRYWWLATGAIAAIGALFRLEFGLAYMCVFLGIALVELKNKIQDIKNAIHNFKWFGIGYFAIFTAWLVVLTNLGGVSALENYLIGTVAGASGAVTDWSINIPNFDFSNPLSKESTLALAYLLVFSSYIVCMYLGICQSISKNQRSLLFATGLMGMAVLPHGIYRADMSHLQQTLGCAVLAIPFAISGLWNALENQSRTVTLITKSSSIVFLVVAVVWGGNLMRGPQAGWSPLLSSSIERFSSYKSIIQSQTVESELSVRIRELTDNEDKILIAATIPQLYYVLNRKLAGRNPIYFKGIYDSGKWARNNLIKIEQDQPQLVVVHRNFSQKQQNLISHLPDELVTFIESNYSNIEYEIAQWQIRTKTVR